MEVKEYKIWRFYHGGVEESKIYVPEGVKFYCFNKKSSIEEYEEEIRLGRHPSHPNQTWVAVIPWSEEIEKMSHSFHWSFVSEKDGIELKDDYSCTQSLSLKSYNLNNNYMIWYLDQICPMTDDFPETEELPTFEPQYIKVRDMDGVELDAGHKLSHLFYDLEGELTDEQFDKFYPINEYFRLDRLNYGGFIATRIVVRHHEVHRSKRLMIEHDDYPFSILDGFPCCPGRERTEASTKEEFENAVKLVLEKAGV